MRDHNIWHCFYNWKHLNAVTLHNVSHDKMSILEKILKLSRTADFTGKQLK